MEFKVDGNRIEAEEGELLIEALERSGREVPSPCYHAALGPLETCDTCMVEIDGKLTRACSHRLEGPTTQVSFSSPRAQQARQEAYARIMGRHELYCTVCDNNDGACETKAAGKLVQIRHQKYSFEKKRPAIDDSNPFYRYDPNQCILCGRCVEACQNVQVTQTLSIDWSAESPVVQWDGGESIEGSSCVSCGHCVTVCPCNALMEKSAVGHAGNMTNLPDKVHRLAVDAVKSVEPVITLKPLFVVSDLDAKLRGYRNEVSKSVCTYCGVGCSFEVHHRKGKIHRIQPNIDSPANGISTCVKGKFGWSYIDSEDRLEAPLVRKDGELLPTSWNEAYEEIARRLTAIVAEHGPDSVGFISSSKITNEEVYLVQKMARAVFGTNNVDNCARYCQTPASKGLSRTVGIGADTGTMDDIDQASLVLVVGSNTPNSHPVLASRIRRRKKRGEMVLVVADLRKHDLVDWADTFIQPTPGSDLFWINAVAKIIWEEGLADQSFLDARVNGLDDYLKSLEPFTRERAAEISGLSVQTLVDLARRIGKAERVCALWAMGLTQHVDGADACTALCNLLLLTGNMGRPGTGGYPLRGHNNVQGACDFGALHNYLPGYQDLDDDEARSRYEAAWGGASIPSSPGLDNTTMVHAAHEGRLKGLFVVGEELRLVDAHTDFVEEALGKLDLLVVQDIFQSRTAELADVVLAAAPSFEKEGTFTNTERRIQRLEPIRAPRGDSKPDWQILTELAAHLGHDWDYAGPSAIMDEVASSTPIFAGVRYDRLQGFDSLVWPVAADGTDTPLLYQDGFAFPDGKARFHPVEWREVSERPDADFPVHLDNGRILQHFHEGNMTFRVEGMEDIVSGAYVEVSSELASQLSIVEGDLVSIRSRRGCVEVPAVLTDAISGSMLYLPLQSEGEHEEVNRLSSSVVDPDVHTPAYKEIAVTVEKVAGHARPLGKNHPSRGHPTPRPGVEVEKKWARADSVPVDRDRPEGSRV